MKKLIPVYTKMKSMLKDETGATMVEYALLVSLISVAAVATIVLIGPQILAAFDAVNAAFP